MQQTLIIIKPDAVRNRYAGHIVTRFEQEGFVIKEARLMTLDRKDAESFYAEHKGKPFFDGLVAFMSSGPCLPIVLEGSDVILRVRALIGATQPAKAAPGTIRALYAGALRGEDGAANAIHASDSPVSASREIPFFFSR